MTSLADFADLLQGFGVDAGDPERRLQKARTMLEAGIDLAGAQVAFTQAEATSKAGKGPRLISFLAMNADRLKAAIVDALAFQAARQARKGETVLAHPDKPYVPGPTQGESREVWEHDRMCRIAHCRVRGDGAKLEVVAAELGVSTTTLGIMLDRGRQLSTSPLIEKSPANPPEPKGASQDRTREFRDQMRLDMRTRSVREAKPFDWARMHREEALLLAHLRKTGLVDLPHVTRDRYRAAAFASLQGLGQIIATAEPDQNQQQPHAIARDDDERKAFRAKRAEWDRMDMARHNQRPAREATGG